MSETTENLSKYLGYAVVGFVALMTFIPAIIRQIQEAPYLTILGVDWRIFLVILVILVMVGLIAIFRSKPE